MTYDAVKRELLVRHLEAWAPAALHRGRRVVYAHGYADADGGAAAEEAVRVLADQPDLVRGRELSMVAVGAGVASIADRLERARQEAGTAVGFAVHTIAGATDERLAGRAAAPGAGRVPGG